VLTVLTQGEMCDHWQLKDEQRTVNYWDIPATTDPKQSSEEGGMNDFSTLFFDFDRGAQYKELFNVSYEFPEVTCHPRQSAEGRLNFFLFPSFLGDLLFRVYAVI